MTEEILEKRLLDLERRVQTLEQTKPVGTVRVVGDNGHWYVLTANTSNPSSISLNFKDAGTR